MAMTWFGDGMGRDGDGLRAWSLRGFRAAMTKKVFYKGDFVRGVSVVRGVSHSSWLRNQFKLHHNQLQNEFYLVVWFIVSFMQ